MVAPPQVVRREPDRLVGRPAAAPPVPPVQPRPAPVPFWKDVQHLAEAQPAGQGVQRLFCPVVVGPDAFVVAMVQDGPNAGVTAQLWKLDPTGRNRPSAVVGTDADPAAYREFANVPGQDPADRVTADWPGTRAAVCGDTYVFTCWGQRVVLFPLVAGGRPRVVTPADVGYPGLSVQAAALMDGVLYLAVGLPGRDGLLVADRAADRPGRHPGRQPPPRAPVAVRRRGPDGTSRPWSPTRPATGSCSTRRPPTGTSAGAVCTRSRPPRPPVPTRPPAPRPRPAPSASSWPTSPRPGGTHRT